MYKYIKEIKKENQRWNEETNRKFDQIAAELKKERENNLKIQLEINEVIENLMKIISETEIKLEQMDRREGRNNLILREAKKRDIKAFIRKILEKKISIVSLASNQYIFRIGTKYKRSIGRSILVSCPLDKLSFTSSSHKSTH